MHLIVESPDKRGLARGVAGIEVRIAKRVNALLGRKGRFWSERSEGDTQHAPYVLMNTQKHHRVIGNRDFACPFSSAATFDGFKRGVEAFREADGTAWPATSRACSRPRSTRANGVQRMVG